MVTLIICCVLGYGLLVNWKTIQSYFKSKKPKSKADVGIGTGMVGGFTSSIFWNIESVRARRDAEKAIDDFRKQELNNPFKNIDDKDA